MTKGVYFISDAHLGSWALDHRRMQERRLVRFLDEIKDKAQAVYMLGDMFDYWYEFKYVVPKGYTRFLGKIAELTDSGVEVHYFIGNHDIWTFGYLERECGVILHREPVTVEIMGKEFFLAHGDGMGDPDRVFRFMRGIFRSRFCQFLYSLLPSRWSIWFGVPLQIILHDQTLAIKHRIGELAYPVTDNQHSAGVTEHEVKFNVTVSEYEIVYIRMLLEVILGI